MLSNTLAGVIQYRRANIQSTMLDMSPEKQNDIHKRAVRMFPSIHLADRKKRLDIKTARRTSFYASRNAAVAK
jgi:hypothetical protein